MVQDRRTSEKRKSEGSRRPSPADGRPGRKAARPVAPAAGRRPAPWMSVAAQQRAQTLRFGRKNRLLFASGIAAILIGFGILATGDITVAPILILLGYLVLIPWSLLAQPKNQQGAAPESAAGSAVREN